MRGCLVASDKLSGGFPVHSLVFCFFSTDVDVLSEQYFKLLDSKLVSWFSCSFHMIGLVEPRILCEIHDAWERAQYFRSTALLQFAADSEAQGEFPAWLAKSAGIGIIDLSEACSSYTPLT